MNDVIDTNGMSGDRPKVTTGAAWPVVAAREIQVRLTDKN